MKISQDIRDAARAQNLSTDEVDAGMAEMSQKFRAGGGELLVPLTPAE